MWYPSYVAYEYYSGQLEEKIEGHIAEVVILEDKNTELKEINFTLEQKNHNLKLGLGIGIPVTAVVLFVTGLIVGRTLK